MSTIVCQNLFSCTFDPHLNDTTATLKLKVTPDPPPLAAAHHLNLQTNSLESTNPLSNKYSSSSYSKLSSKSLDLCTENLGSETGSDTASDCTSIFSTSPLPSPTSNSGGDRHRASALDACNHTKSSPSPAKSRREIKNFPPPLTTMSGLSSLQVRRRSDGGRLIIEVVEGPFRNSYLHAERSGGRLKLCFAAAAPADREDEEEIMDNECDGGDEVEREEEKIEEPNKEFESELELKEKFQRFSRCKEGSHGNKGLCSNWKPALWVAIS